MLLGIIHLACLMLPLQMQPLFSRTYRSVSRSRTHVGMCQHFYFPSDHKSSDSHISSLEVELETKTFLPLFHQHFQSGLVDLSALLESLPLGMPVLEV
ncbi:hypothetical protein XELAEV_18026995mg [Xenopus laevis]|uniref:Uncharacterized protein n=1 Tax=Xenopus laevis TaxID=8355 RepID=A0A974HJK1_XENLA|nr:hypothetical protein XELAEV_18026995mg [Xenopus laevis]